MSSLTDTYCSTTALFDDQSCVEDSCAEEERRHDVAALTAEDALTGDRVEDACQAKSVLYVSTAKLPRVRWMGCGQCRWRQAGVLLLGIFLTLSALTLVMVGAIRSSDHTAVKVIHIKHPVDFSTLREANFTIAQLLRLRSIAQGKPVTLSSTPTDYSVTSSLSAQFTQHPTVDGVADSCSETALEQSPSWQVDLQHNYSITSVRILAKARSDLTSLRVEVSSTQPNITKEYRIGSEVIQCHRANGEDRRHEVDSLDIRIVCPPGIKGRYVAVKLQSKSEGSPVRLSLCEVMVFSS